MYENLKEIILEITNETNSACIVSSFYCYIKRDSIVLLLIADAVSWHSIPKFTENDESDVLNIATSLSDSCELHSVEAQM